MAKCKPCKTATYVFMWFSSTGSQSNSSNSSKPLVWRHSLGTPMVQRFRSDCSELMIGKGSHGWLIFTIEQRLPERPTLDFKMCEMRENGKFARVVLNGPLWVCQVSDIPLSLWPPVNTENDNHHGLCQTNHNTFWDLLTSGLFFHRFSGNHWKWNFRNSSLGKKFLSLAKNPWVLYRCWK